MGWKLESTVIQSSPIARSVSAYVLPYFLPARVFPDKRWPCRTRHKLPKIHREEGFEFDKSELKPPTGLNHDVDQT